jgi:chromosome partitioning protein
MDRQSVLRPPAGITHVVLDTPGGLRGADLSRAVVAADAVLMPVCASQFDRESALECHAELMAIPRVASGRCKVGVVGMRLDARTRAAAEMPLWAASHGLPYVGVLRDTQNYLRVVEQGLTLFDLAPSRVEADLEQWKPILGWLHQAWREAAQAEQNARATVRPVDARQRPPSDLLEPVGRGARQQAKPRVLAPSGRLDWLFSVFRSPTT